MRVEDMALEIRMAINCLDDNLRVFNIYPKFRKEMIKDIEANVKQISKLCDQLKQKVEEE